MAFNLPGIPSGKPAAKPATNKKPAQSAPKLPSNNKAVPKTETGPNKPGYVPPALIGMVCLTPVTLVLSPPALTLVVEVKSKVLMELRKENAEVIENQINLI